MTCFSLPIRSLHGSLYHVFVDSVFYDLAKDPPDSYPAEIQPEFGHTIFGKRPNEGAINLEKVFANLASQVESKGASMATFHKISEIMLQLRDGHIAAPKVQSDFNINGFQVIPERFLFQQATTDVSTYYYLNDKKNIELVLTYNTTDSETGLSTVEEYQVDKINGKCVHDFLIDVMSNPKCPGSDSNLGTRLNTVFLAGYFFRIRRIRYPIDRSFPRWIWGCLY